MLNSYSLQQQPTDKGPFDYLSTTDSSSVYVVPIMHRRQMKNDMVKLQLFRMAVIHDQDAYPDFSKDGFRVASGTQVLVALSKVRLKNHRMIKSIVYSDRVLPHLSPLRKLLLQWNGEGELLSGI